MTPMSFGTIHPQSPRHQWTRIATSIGIVALLLLVNLPQLDRRANEYSNRLMQRALIAFAVARGVDSAISMAQGTEVALQPAGLGVTLTPGELLDPVNDMVEQLSNVLLWAAAVAGMQKLLLAISSWGWLTAALSLLLVIYGLGLWRRLPFPRPLSTALGVLLLVRLAVPGIALANEATYQMFLQRPYEESRQSLELAEAEVLRSADEVDDAGRGSAAPGQAAPAEPAVGGFLGRAQRWIAGAGAALDPRPHMRALKASAERAVEGAVQLIALFMLQTIVLPLLFIWLLQRVFFWILRPRQP